VLHPVMPCCMCHKTEVPAASELPIWQHVPCKSFSSPKNAEIAYTAAGACLPQDYTSAGHMYAEEGGSLALWPPSQRRFNHIVGYGATYYSYLYAQCLSANIWQRHFAADPLSREAGEAVRHKLLEPGIGAAC
jgi:hypothetical protein